MFLELSWGPLVTPSWKKAIVEKKNKMTQNASYCPLVVVCGASLRYQVKQHEAPASFYSGLSEDLSSCCLFLQHAAPCFIILHVFILHFVVLLRLCSIYLIITLIYCIYRLLDLRKHRKYSLKRLGALEVKSSSLLVIISPEQLLQLWWTCCILVNRQQQLFWLSVLLEPGQEWLWSGQMKHICAHKRAETCFLLSFGWSWKMFWLKLL